MIKTRRHSYIVFAALFFLAGCTAVSEVLQQTNEYVFFRDVNLQERNYAAADYLSSITGATIDKRTTLLVPEPLLHANNTGMTSPFGTLVSEQVGVRFAQLGYRVHLTDDRNPRTASPATIPAPNEGVSISGTYLPGGSHADIRLRLVERATGRVLGAFDYSLPVNREVSRLMKDQPTAFRIQE
ncbi:MAG: hypothetical protein ACK4VI_05280 [Alphaproteobacteria bacterium]